jgi:hypothetical protein
MPRVLAVTVLSPSRDGSGGTQPSRTARALVVHADPWVRDGWARALEASGLSVIRCVGPTVTCILDRGGTHCPLLDEADLALYYEPLLTEAFVDELTASRPGAMIIACRDRHRSDGDHEPALARVITPRTTSVEAQT